MICLPGGGFNDMLAVISRCLNYSVKHDRLLIIDTTKAEWFKKNIHDYISFQHKNIYIGNIKQIIPIYPNYLYILNI